MHNSFAQWQQEVSHELYVTEGFLLEELPDFHWWIFFNNGMSPAEAVRAYFGLAMVEQFPPRSNIAPT